jgi:hypothetical protein
MASEVAAAPTPKKAKTNDGIHHPTGVVVEIVGTERDL